MSDTISELIGMDHELHFFLEYQGIQYEDIEECIVTRHEGGSSYRRVRIGVDRFKDMIRDAVLYDPVAYHEPFMRAEL